MVSPSIRLADVTDHETVSSVLANAFASDPVLVWFMGNPSDAERRLGFMFRHLVRTELAKDVHAVDVVEGGDAAALWHEVDDWRTPNHEVVRMLPSVVRTFGWRLPRALSALTMMEKVHPVEPHLHLAFIGVQADRQSQGLGSALLASMTERCDSQGLPAYLENTNPRNEPLYARHGFESRGPIPFPKGAPPVLAMWRNPR